MVQDVVSSVAWASLARLQGKERWWMSPLKVPRYCFGTERGHNDKVISESCFQEEWVQPEADVLGFPSSTPDMVTWNISGVHKSGCHVDHAANCLWWHLIYAGSQYGTHFMSPFWCLEF